MSSARDFRARNRCRKALVLGSEGGDGGTEGRREGGRRKNFTSTRLRRRSEDTSIVDEQQRFYRTRSNTAMAANAAKAAKALAAALKTSATLQEVRFTLSPVSAGSAHLRDLLTASYTDLKKVNPNLPILIREHEESLASVTARFPMGEERKTSLEGCGVSDVVDKMKALLT
jgi:NADH dehydrogenase (ubiquinone) 1 alpha subcomplex subunit 2